MMADEKENVFKVEDSSKKEVETKSADITEELIKKISFLEEELKELDDLKKWQNYIPRIGVVVILGLLVLFSVNLWSLVTSFDRVSFQKHLEQKSQAMYKPRIKMLVKDFKRNVVPHLKSELVKIFDDRKPHIKKSLENTKHNLSLFIHEKFKEKLDKRFTHIFDNIKKNLAISFPAAEVEEVFKNIMGEKMKLKFQSQFADYFIDEKLASLQSSIGSLQDSIQKLSKSKEVKNLSREDLEDAFLEAFFDSLKYRFSKKNGATLLLQGKMK